MLKLYIPSLTNWATTRAKCRLFSGMYLRAHRTASYCHSIKDQIADTPSTLPHTHTHTQWHSVQSSHWSEIKRFFLLTQIGSTYDERRALYDAVITDWRIDSLIDWLIDWLTDWSTNPHTHAHVAQQLRSVYLMHLHEKPIRQATGMKKEKQKTIGWWCVWATGQYPVNSRPRSAFKKIITNWKFE